MPRAVTILLALLLAALSASVASAAPRAPAPRAPAPRAPAPLRVAWGQAQTIHAAALTVADPQSTPEGPGEVTLQRAGTEASRGEGIIALTMSAPGTSWSSSRNTAAIAQVSVDGGTPQTIELFYGGRRFTYEGFLGPLAAGRHTIRIEDSSALSDARDSPSLRVERIQLGIVPQSDASYFALAYAPFIYGRSSSPQGYIPLLTYVDQSAGADGSHTLSYTYVISAHDQGDSIVPAYQWGTWGRMTDIVSVITEKVAADGTVQSATYSSCACEGTPYPDSLQSPSDSASRPFTGTWLGHHPMLRDATATNYLSQDGTTPYRFQQAPVAGPPAGQVREEVMDAHPWTYQVSNEELPREHLISTDPDNLLVGDYRQYAIIDSDVEVGGADAVEFDIQLAGSATWYTTDYAQMFGGVPSTFAFHDGGHNRTVIKLPLDWGSRAITAMRVRVTVSPGSPPATVKVNSLRVLEISGGWRVRERRLPSISVVQATALDPSPLPV